MKKRYIAPVYDSNHKLVRYAGAEVEATPPEMQARLKKGDGGVRLAPLNTGRNAAYAAVLKTLAPGERVSKHSFCSVQ